MESSYINESDSLSDEKGRKRGGRERRAEGDESEHERKERVEGIRGGQEGMLK